MAGRVVSIAARARVAFERNVPVLCMDACSLLDIVRAPTLSYAGQVIAAAQAMVAAQAAGTLTVVMAPVIPEELRRNYPTVRGDLDNQLARIDRELKPFDDCLTACGLSERVPSLVHSGLAGAVENVYNSLARACDLLDEEPAARAAAISRAIDRRRPAKRGTIHDPLIIEHYLMLGRELRGQRFGNAFVFVSSNTADYLRAGVIHPDLSADFIGVSLQYADKLPAARRALGF
jgi:hypothetical protein